MPKKKSGILRPGDEVKGTYKVKFFLGEGAFGEVYQVVHNFLGLQVMKVFKEDYVENTDIDVLMNEAKVLATLNHKNIVRVFEANHFCQNNNEHYYITLNHVSGETLSKRLYRDIKFDLSFAISIQRDILKALSYVHTQSVPIVHRDINPDNILLEYNDEEILGKLADFGLAQSIGQLKSITNAAGRYLFFAPECFWGSYLPTSDVFSVGIVFYQMLTGIMPWRIDLPTKIDSQKEIIDQIRISRKEAPKKPSYYNSSIDSDLDEIVLKSLELSIEDRYNNANEFYLDFKTLNFN